MTTLVLQSAGAALGGALGGPLGAGLGRVLGAAGGAALDGALFGAGAAARHVEGPRLSEVAGLTSTEGDPIPRVYGRARIGGTLIWASRPLEVANTTVERSASGAKGGGGGQRTVRTAYSYYANLAVGLCAGEIAMVRRVFADGRELDLTRLAVRVHAGGPDQAPDPLIVAIEGPGRAPAYRGLAYCVFERLPLAEFGNRIPQFAFEVIRPVGGLAETVRAVCLIPGSTEFGLDPTPVTEDAGFGVTRGANRFQLQGLSDVVASLDALQALCPQLARVSVVASWFGDDLRAGACTVGPRVDAALKTTRGDAWRVAGLTRAQAPTVSTAPDGGPAYGGTPSDAGLGRLVAELGRRGLEVVLYPFLMMDVPANNDRPDPRRPGAVQPPYPWRGRITCDPAPGLPGSPDGTAQADAQVAAFFDGPQGYARLVRHYADLARGWAETGHPLAGFVIGSEFVGLTRVRGAGGRYPAAEALRRLAQEVRARLGPATRLTYAADWTEYGAHVREAGAYVRFPLDPLFADPALDAVGIDFYPPLTDWRDGGSHADRAEADTIYDRAYLKHRVAAGEAFDWYYRDEADRAAQRRSPIEDGAYGKPWIHRAKDLVGWWSSAHVERVDGIETGPTAWVPRSKPIWLTEIGVPAVDRGTNGPNVFPDPKSAENAAPPFSRGTPDPLIQARGLEAILARFDPALPGFETGHNPVSPLYGGRMVDPGHVYVWCWDARPYPAFPDLGGVWRDAGNWTLGHWITGRAEGMELDRLVAAILADHGLPPADIVAEGFLDGAVIDRPLSARGVLEPLCRLYGLQADVAAGRLRLRSPAAPAVALADADLVEGEAPSLTRAEAGEVPNAVAIGFTDGATAEYRRANATAEGPQGAGPHGAGAYGAGAHEAGAYGASRAVARIEAAVVIGRGQAQALAEAALEEALAGRENARLTVSPRRLDLEPGDRVRLPPRAGGGLHRILRIADTPAGRRLETRAVPAEGARAPATGGPPGPRPPRTPPALPGPPFAAPLALPAGLGPTRGAPPPLLCLAAAAEPWPGALAVWRGPLEGALAPHLLLDHPACLGETLDALPPGPVWRRDRGANLPVRLRHAAGLADVDAAAQLAGANTFAVLAPGGQVEIVSAARAELVAPDGYRLGRLLRGLAGTEAAAGIGAPAGSLIVRLDDGAVLPLVTDLDEAGRSFRYRIGPADRDPADPAYAGFTASAGLGPLAPPAPVHLRARRTAAGVHLTWIRRARRDADAWEPAEIPLEGPREAYRVAILRPQGASADASADVLLRVIEAGAPAAFYAAADEAADFGTPQAALTVAVSQRDAVAGLGPAARARITVRTA